MKTCSFTNSVIICTKSNKKYIIWLINMAWNGEQLNLAFQCFWRELNNEDRKEKGKEKGQWKGKWWWLEVKQT
jgi:hypothetical protein